VLFTLEVTYEGDESGSADLAFDAEDTEVLDPETEALDVTYRNASVVAGDLGDVNLDGEVTVGDAVLTQQSIAGQEPADEFNAALADLDGSGTVTISDVLGILDEVTAAGESAGTPQDANEEVSAPGAAA